MDGSWYGCRAFRPGCLSAAGCRRKHGIRPTCRSGRQKRRVFSRCVCIRPELGNYSGNSRSRGGRAFARHGLDDLRHRRAGFRRGRPAGRAAVVGADQPEKRGPGPAFPATVFCYRSPEAPSGQCECLTGSGAGHDRRRRRRADGQSRLFRTGRGRRGECAGCRRPFPAQPF